MPPTLTADIRAAYLKFFQSKGHAVIGGASLVPENDPTVLFTTAGMHPLVPYLMGEKHPQGNRLVDVQLCVRTQDIDEVGDSSHLTCFEMLGRWSMGDYFKEGAITMSYEFLTEILGIPKHMLAVSCFAGDSDAPRDDESAAIWKKVGIPEERIGFLPKAKNWWGPAGKTGPCGPDTEMFYWNGKGEPTGNPATHDAEWLEIGNDVLIQYNKTEAGIYEPLAQKNLDEGMGLERLACVLQKVASVYDTDAFRPILEKIENGKLKMENSVRHVRIIVDHLKAATFMLAEGVRPSNVDQGYVLRRLIRRAIRSARTIGIENAAGFCSSISDAVIDQYGDFYGKIRTEKTAITDALNREEQQFGAALTEGIKHFVKVCEKSTDNNIAGIDAFHLYDTYGFPIEMTREMAQEKGLKLDEDGFKKAFGEHQILSRAGAEKRFAGGLADHSAETTKLHTATHLLNAALQQVLGEHVYQKGSNITAERLRFDFNHPEKMTPEQIKKVEELVNEAIKADAPISYSVMTVDEAKASGAIGVFGDKYGEKVKVYTMGGPSALLRDRSGRGEQSERLFSLEICGGPHVARTGMLGTFKIQKEESSSAGIRRIKAVVSGGPKDIENAWEST